MLYELIRKMSHKGMTNEAIAALIDLPPQEIAEITESDQSIL